MGAPETYSGGPPARPADAVKAEPVIETAPAETAPAENATDSTDIATTGAAAPEEGAAVSETPTPTE